MKHKAINYTPADENILSQLETLVSVYNINYNRPESYADVSLQFIQKVCAEAWKVPESKIIGRVNHTDALEKARKVSFLCACFWYSNKDCNEIAAYMGCYSTMVCNSNDRMLYEIKHRLKYAGQYLEIFKALSEICPNRIAAYCKIDLSMIKGVEHEPNLPLELYLTPAKISELPVKSLSWFYNDNTKFTMIAYSPDGKKVAKIVFSRTSDHKLLHAMQGQGYRFINYDEYCSDDRLKKLIADTERMMAQTQQMLNDQETWWLPKWLPQYVDISSSGLHVMLRERYGKIQLQ